MLGCSMIGGAVVSEGRSSGGSEIGAGGKAGTSTFGGAAELGLDAGFSGFVVTAVSEGRVKYERKYPWLKT